jgi:ribulose-bisphosphate carboxylase small chain
MSAATEIGNFETTSTLETFGFLPKMDMNEIQAQVAYILGNNWSPAIEHEHPSRAFDHYWTMWKLPFFGEQNINTVLAELEACHRAFPDHHVRLTGYDNYTQSQGAAFVVFEGRG